MAVVVVGISKVAQEEDRFAALADRTARLVTPAFLFSFSVRFAFHHVSGFLSFFSCFPPTRCCASAFGHALQHTPQYRLRKPASADFRRRHVRCATPRARYSDVVAASCQPCDPIIEFRGAAVVCVFVLAAELVTFPFLVVRCIPSATPRGVVKMTTSFVATREPFTPLRF